MIRKRSVHLNGELDIRRQIMHVCVHVCVQLVTTAYETEHTHLYHPGPQRITINMVINIYI